MGRSLKETDHLDGLEQVYFTFTFKHPQSCLIGINPHKVLNKTNQFLP